MRISDWSSDVCSSDLLLSLPRGGDSRRRGGRRSGRGQGHDRHRLDRHRRRRWHLFVLGVHPSLLHPSLFRWRIGGGGFIVSRAEEGDLEAVRPADRKSVVEGKRVYVRVDLGGRRIIKKKNPSRH